MKFLSTLALMALVTLPTAAQAEDSIIYPRRDGNRSGSNRSETTYGGVRSMPIDLTARAGFFNYERAVVPASGAGSNAADNGATSAIGGIALDWNASETVGTESPIYYGASTGLSFTRVEGAADDSNLFIVPVNALLGYHVTDQFLAAANTGVSAFVQGDSSVLGISENGLKLLPNLGANASYSFTDDVALTARADWTFAENQTPFMGTLGVSFPLGG